MRTNEKFGNRLRRIRIEAGFTSQGQLASVIGVTTQTINYYEQGKRKPDYEIFEKLSEALKVSCDYLLGRTESRVPENIDIAAELGLSDAAISRLRHYKQLEINGESEKMDFINTLLGSKYGEMLITAFSTVITFNSTNFVPFQTNDGEDRKIQYEQIHEIKIGDDCNGKHTQD